MNDEKDIILMMEGNFNFIYRNTANKDEIIWEYTQEFERLVKF
jgi:hypothetical protein